MNKMYSETSPYLLRRPRSLAEVLTLREKRAQARKNTPQVTPGGIVVPLHTIQKKHNLISDDKTPADVSAEILARFRRASEDQDQTPRQVSDAADKIDRVDIIQRLDKFALLLRDVGSIGLAQRIESRASDIRDLDIEIGDSDR